MKSNVINYDEISKVLYYDDTSPSGLRWKVSAGRAKTNDIAGTVRNNSRTGRQYYTVRINSKSFYAHRIVYVLHYQRLQPELQIDHIDGDSLNNQIDNLRAVTHQTNCRNQKQYTTNKTGVTGVCYDALQNRYAAHCCDQHGKFNRKYFSCNKYGTDKAFELACAWRNQMIANINAISGTDGYTDRHGIPE